MEKINEIEMEVDQMGLPKAPKQKMKLGRTAKIGMTLLISSLMIFGAYAGVMTHFGQVHVTMNTHQSIVVGDGDVWYEGTDSPPISRELGDVAHCTDYCYKLLIKNQGCEDADVWFTELPTQESNMDGVAISHHVFGDTQTIKLVWKDAQWQQINPTSYANVTFNTCGETFNYDIDYYNLQGEYSLIYYFDTDPDRFADWGHCLVLANVIFTGTGGVANTIDVQTMPYESDANAWLPADYTVSDGYEHARGAKLWLVPQTALTNPIPGVENKLIAWNPSTYLFETDLFLYIDCDNWEPYCLPDVFGLFDTEIDDTEKYLLHAESTYCWITCYHLDFGIETKQVAFDTFVHGQAHVEI